MQCLRAMVPGTNRYTFLEAPAGDVKHGGRDSSQLTLVLWIVCPEEVCFHFTVLFHEKTTSTRVSESDVDVLLSGSVCSLNITNLLPLKG